MVDDNGNSEGPITAALFDTALLSVWNLFERLRESRGNGLVEELFSDPDLMLNYLKRAAEDPHTDGDASVEALWAWVESGDEERAGATIILVADTIIAYATQAMNAEEVGDWATGWKYAGEARYWEGILNGIRLRKLLDPGNDEAEISLEKPAVAMANSRHAETAALRAEVVAFYHANVDPTWSAAKAAEYISEKRIVPLTFRTIQTYISVEKKRRRQVDTSTK